MRTYQGACVLSSTERHALQVAMARVRAGQSVVHPKGRPAHSAWQDFTREYTQAYPSNYPSVGSRHVVDRSP